MDRRVVITGIGVVSPIGHTNEELINSMRTGYCGIDEISQFDPSDHKVKLAAEVKNLNLEDYIDKKTLRRLDRVNQLGLIAAMKTMEDGQVDLESLDRSRIGVEVSTGIGGLRTIEEEYDKGSKKGFDRVSPFFIPMSISNLTASHIAIEFGLHGESTCPVTACAGSSTAIGEGFRKIKYGYLDMCLAGGSEASITPLAIGGFTAMKALTESEDKNRASIPFDKERSGFVMGEGSAILILEDLDHAIKRGAKIYAEVVGYGATSDANHVTAPREDGLWAGRAMEMAIEDGGIEPKDIDYINAHGTSTPLNDKIETLAIKKALKEYALKPYVSSTKSMTGHLLGASGSMEVILSILAMNQGFIPATVNYRLEDEDCDLNIVKNDIIEGDIQYFLSNSLGFGGHNTSLLIKRWE